MSDRYIFTYFESLPDMDMVGERILVTLWRQAWEKAGLTPIVLSEYWARQHPIFPEFDAAVSKLPSINPAGYDRACYLRWLAAQVAANEYNNWDNRIIMADFDVFPYVKRWSHYNDKAPMISLHGNCPALVFGTQEQFADVCHAFATYSAPAGQTHISDQYIFELAIMAHPEKFKVSMDCVLYGEPGWDKAAAVHYSNSVMQPAGKTPKYQHIPTLR